jgi:uncharacterized protein (DUF885 family)
MLDRRLFLSSSAAALAATGLPAFAADAALNSLFATMFQEKLEHGPEGATQLGLDKGANAGLRSKLSDGSAAGYAAAKALNASQMARLEAFDAKALTGMDKVNYDTVLYTARSRARLQAFDFGDGGSSPYVVSQLTGVYQDVPDFLDTKHPIENAADADAYLARLAQFGGEIDNDTARLKHDSAQGVVPPDFILDLTLTQLGKTHVAPDQLLLVTSIARRAKAKGLPDSYAEKARALYEQGVAPALERQIAAVSALRANATHDASLRKVKDGPAYYAAALHSYTTTDMTPDEIHKLGLDQGKEILARLDTELKAQGLTKGSVGARIAALDADPKYLYPNTDAGKIDMIAYCNGRLDAVRPRLPRAFHKVPAYKFEVRRVPPATEAGAASAFSQGASLDGSRPGIVYINLKDSAEWPRFSLASVIFHEGLPGHQLETSLALANADLPLIRKTILFSGYAEGWGLYAEQLADELGMYEDDRVSRIGYLKFMMFRASRCVVDTGIFHLGWSREQAIQYFVDTEGETPGFAAREVERYCTRPGQACAYKIGHTVWTRGRARAQKALGAKYDIKDFHDAGLSCGRVPLDILDGVIDGYIKSKA